MGDMGNITAAAGNHKEEFKTGKTQYHYRRPKREYAPNINNGIGKEDSEGKLNGENGAGCAHKGGEQETCKPVNQKRKNSCKNSCKKIIKKEFPAAHVVFNLAAKNKKCKHIEQDMAYGARIVDEHICYKLPN